MMTTSLRDRPELSAAARDHLAFERAVVRIETHPKYARLDPEMRRQIDDIIRFARTSPDKHVYTSRLIAALG